MAAESGTGEPGGGTNPAGGRTYPRIDLAGSASETVGDSAVGVDILQVGSTFGRFRMETVLGFGAFGAVYQATDTRSGAAVAVELLLAPTQRRRARFLREGEVVQRFEHPNIIRIHEIGEHEGRAYHAMELVEGEPLDRLAPLPYLRAARSPDMARLIAEAERADGPAPARTTPEGESPSTTTGRSRCSATSPRSTRGPSSPSGRPLRPVSRR